MIMVDKLAKAQDIWERLHKNPGGFEKIAQDESMDAGSRSLGGQLAEPITRHAYPRNVADAAFRQLVDGDADDKDPTHDPRTATSPGPSRRPSRSGSSFAVTRSSRPPRVRPSRTSGSRSKRTR